MRELEAVLEAQGWAGQCWTLARIAGRRFKVEYTLAGLDAASKAGLTPSQMAISRPICPVCRLVIRVNGGEISDNELGATWP